MRSRSPSAIAATALSPVSQPAFSSARKCVGLERQPFQRELADRLCSAGLATHRGNTRACFHIWDNARIENPIFCHALQRTTEVRRATQAAQTKLRSPELV